MTAALTVDITIADPAWTTALPGAEDVVRETVLAAWRALPAKSSGPAEISVLLGDDEIVRDLNREHRGKDQPTNVLSFPIDEADGSGDAPVMLGDVVLASGVVLREASAQGKPVVAHVRHLVVHGVLHLLGFDHETDQDADRMESLEIEILGNLAVPNPYIYRGAAE